MPMPPMMTAAGIPVMPLAYPGPFAAPYTHMSDHSSSESTEAQELPHDHPHYPHDLVHYPPDPASYPVDPAVTTHFPQDPNHYPRPPPRRRSCAHSFQADREVRAGGVGLVFSLTFLLFFYFDLFPANVCCWSLQ